MESSYIFPVTAGCDGHYRNACVLFLWCHQAVMMSASYQVSYLLLKSKEMLVDSFLQVLDVDLSGTKMTYLTFKQKKSTFYGGYEIFSEHLQYLVICCSENMLNQRIDSVKQYFSVWVCLHLVADYFGAWEKQDRNSALTKLHHACGLHCAYTAQIQRGCQWKFCISFLRVQ